ncbi:hypothetical protein AVEN_177501-1 [Araneus ventricosus]|uniref:Uncharacterized protein n=1 Tax=Araneus ventricosus TaxID=182803 RepID=A0A4Y2D2N8_ARAVE|nr:hypothetical protein AVEN_177501-1 [Araneus ventricosus]
MNLWNISVGAREGFFAHWSWEFLYSDVSPCDYDLIPKKSFVILTCRFEATRGLFLGRTRHFEPRSDDGDGAWASAPSPSFRATPAGGRLATTHVLACNWPHTRRIFSEIGFRTWNSPAPKPRPYHWASAAPIPKKKEPFHGIRYRTIDGTGTASGILRLLHNLKQLRNAGDYMEGL